MLILSVPILLLTWKMGGFKQKVLSSKLFIRSRYEYLEIKAEMLISCLIFIFWCQIQMFSVYSKNKGIGLLFQYFWRALYIRLSVSCPCVVSLTVGLIWATHAFHYIRHDITFAKWVDDVWGGEVNEEQLDLTYNDILLKWNSSNGNYTPSKTNQTLNSSKFVTGNWRTEIKTDWKYRSLGKKNTTRSFSHADLATNDTASSMLKVPLLYLVRYQNYVPSSISSVLREKISEESIFIAQVWVNE